MPAHSRQFLLLLLVTLLVPPDLGLPKLSVGVRYPATLRILNSPLGRGRPVSQYCFLAIVPRYSVPMPEATIYKDARSVFP